jgi:hypothetical protein
MCIRLTVRREPKKFENHCYRQLVGLLGPVISPVARPLPTQVKTTEEMRTDIDASSGIRTHDHNV